MSFLVFESDSYHFIIKIFNLDRSDLKISPWALINCDRYFTPVSDIFLDSVIDQENNQQIN